MRLTLVAHIRRLYTELCPDRYYKKDMALSSGQGKLKDLQMKQLRSGRIPHAQYVENMVRTFRDIKARFHPVLRHYFFERFLLPSAWFHMRLAYSRSVAVGSIVGHIVGLGDRHISNILIDQNSGELVHIDLGIAFDQVGLLIPYSRRLSHSFPFNRVNSFLSPRVYHSA